MKADTTPALYVIKLVDVLREQGQPCSNALRKARITAGELSQSDNELQLDKYLRLVDSAVDEAGIDDLGFLVGERTGTLEHGVMGYALLSSRSLSDALFRYTRYQGVVGPLLDISLNVEGDFANMTVVPRDRGRMLRVAALRYFVQEWLATWNPWTRLIGVRGSFFSDVTVGLPDQEFSEIYRHHLGCRVSFGDGPTVARFPVAHLERSLNHVDDVTGALCNEQCELLLKAQNLRQGLTAEIHRQIAKTPGQMPNMEEVASRLGRTSRTLRRQLLREGSTYQEVVVQHRLAMAKRYLVETSLSTSDIADLVGYADPANLYRSFRTLEGVTPVAYRHRQSASR